MEAPSQIDRQTFAACLMLCEPVFEEFARTPKPPEIWNADKGMQLWVEAIEKYRKHFKEMPNVSVMTMLVKTLHSKAAWAQEYTDETTQHNLLIQGAMAMAKKMIDDPPEQIEKVGTKLLRIMLFYYLRAKVSDRAMSSGDFSAMLESASREVAHINAIDGGRFKNPFPNNDMPKREMRFEPTGIDFIDAFCGGGLLSGEVIGHAAPIGSGKTTLVLQVVWERAQRLMRRYPQLPIDQLPWDKMPKIYSFFFENVENLYANFISHAGMIHRDSAFEFIVKRDHSVLSSSTRGDYKGYELVTYAQQLEQYERTKENPPMGELERFQQVAYISNQLIKLVDFSGGDQDILDFSERGVRGMADYVKGDQHRLKDPGVDLALLDYVGTLVQVGMSSGYYREKERTNVIKSIPTELTREIATKYRCPVWAAHQLNSEQNDQKGGTIPNPNKTDGSHMFLENCALGFASGKLSDENVAVFVAGKNRRAEKKSIMLACLGKRFATWSGANDSHQLSDGVVVNKREAALKPKQQMGRLPPRISGFEDEVS